METNFLTKTGFIILLITLMGGVISESQAQRSLFQDIKAHQIGDIITIVLTENISGSATADARNTSDSNANASGSVSGNFIPFEPTFGSGLNVNYGANQRNTSTQGQLLNGFMSVQIRDVTGSGDLIVEGNRLTEINGEKHEMSLTGVVRPMDIDSQNRVLSYRVANADIVYNQYGGRFSEVTKRRGFLTRAVLTGLGIGLSAVIVTKEFL